MAESSGVRSVTNRCPVEFIGASWQVLQSSPYQASNPHTAGGSMSNRKFSFVHLDVFTSRWLEGNQLAVFTDARGLSDEEMQKLAREMNLAETTFILPRDEATERASGHKVRIFTVNEELPFAGHPTLGTAWYLKQHSGENDIVLDLKVGRVPVRFEERDGRLF